VSVHGLNPKKVFSPGQAEELNRLSTFYPDLINGAFVAEPRDRWWR
jgi:hypothetical protein